MRLAQQLYEGVNGEEEASSPICVLTAPPWTMKPFNRPAKPLKVFTAKEFVSPDVRVYKRKARNAQEAHEAIRPTQFDKTPKSLMGKIDKDLWALYDIIWRRAVASQMASALFDQVTFVLTHLEGKLASKLQGVPVAFVALEVYLEGKDRNLTMVRPVPYPLSEGMTLSLKKLIPPPTFHRTATPF